MYMFNYQQYKNPRYRVISVRKDFLHSLSRVTFLFLHDFTRYLLVLGFYGNDIHSVCP